jgi:hypothetical protein
MHLRYKWSILDVHRYIFGTCNGLADQLKRRSHVGCGQASIMQCPPEGNRVGDRVAGYSCQVMHAKAVATRYAALAAAAACESRCSPECAASTPAWASQTSACGCAAGVACSCTPIQFSHQHGGHCPSTAWQRLGDLACQGSLLLLQGLQIAARGVAGYTMHATWRPGAASHSDASVKHT